MRHVIVGSSAAGLAAARSILEVEPGANVTLLSEESDLPYCRPLISYWLAGETPEKLFPLRTERLGRVEIRLSSRAVALDPASRELRTSSGETLRYDRLLLATGASSARLGMSGEELPNVRGFRTWDDARALDAELRRGAQAALVLGGGLVGVKACHALARRGVAVTLCIGSGHPLSQVVDDRAGTLVADALAREGAVVRTGLTPSACEARHGRASAVAFSSGERLPCDVVVIGKGVTPRVELVSSLGVEAQHGIPVGSDLQTPLPGVWSAGDAALAYDVAWGRPRVNAIWPLAVEQGALAGRNMAGAGETYVGGIAMNALRVGDLELVSAGITRPPDASFEVRSVLDRERAFYRKLVLRAGRVVGVIVAGQIHQAGLLVSAVRRGARVEELPFDPLEPNIHWGSYAFAAHTLGGEEAGQLGRVESVPTGFRTPGLPASQPPSGIPSPSEDLP